jgi:hypothetical protein
MAFCEFRPNDGEAQGGVALGNTFAFADIITRSRGTGHNPGEKALHPWFPGSVATSTVDSNCVSTFFSFNKGNQGWHYAWQSHRMTRATKHELHIFILAGAKNSNVFTCVCELSSPAFDIHCRRKRNNPVKAAASLNNLMNLQAPQMQMPVAPPAMAGIKRDASEMMSSGSEQKERSVSPKRQMAELTKQRYVMDHIMPSNTVATSPGGIYRSLQSRKPIASITSALPVWQPPVQAASDKCHDIMFRIQQLETWRQQLVMQQGELKKLPSFTPSPTSVDAQVATMPPPAAPPSAAPPAAGHSDALALLALCC